MRDRFDIFGAVIRIRKLSLLLVMTLRMPNKHFWRRYQNQKTKSTFGNDIKNAQQRLPQTMNPLSKSERSLFGFGN